MKIIYPPSISLSPVLPLGDKVDPTPQFICGLMNEEEHLAQRRGGDITTTHTQKKAGWNEI